MPAFVRKSPHGRTDSKAWPRAAQVVDDAGAIDPRLPCASPGAPVMTGAARETGSLLDRALAEVATAGNDIPRRRD